MLVLSLAEMRVLQLDLSKPSLGSGLGIGLRSYYWVKLVRTSLFPHCALNSVKKPKSHVWYVCSRS